MPRKINRDTSNVHDAICGIFTDIPGEPEDVRKVVKDTRLSLERVANEHPEWAPEITRTVRLCTSLRN